MKRNTLKMRFVKMLRKKYLTWKRIAQEFINILIVEDSSNEMCIFTRN